MFRHVILLRFRDDTTEAARRALHEALAGLPAAIPEIRSYRFGDDALRIGGNWDFALVAEFDSVDGYQAYRTHPAHLAVIESYIKPILKERAAVQFDAAGE
ncbi:MAG: Dabb family protein [bacterium]